MSAVNSTFTAAVPGMSIAHHKLGELPHEKPPKYTDPNEVLEFFWKQFNRPDMLKQIWMLLEQGATVFAITRAILYKAALMGEIQMSLMVVLAPTVAQMLATIGKSKGIDVKMFPKFKDKTADALMDQHINTKLGKRPAKPIPSSAMKSMLLPTAKKITADHKKFLGMPIAPPQPTMAQPSTMQQPQPPAPTPPQAGKGLLNKIQPGNV